MSKTTPVNYYNAEDVMELTGYGICKCRKLIKSTMVVTSDGKKK